MNSSRRITSGYIYDPQWRSKANSEGRNYWYEYLREMNEQLGLRSEAVAPAALDNPEQLAHLSSLILGGLEERVLSEKQKANLEAWARAGGILIGLGCEGLDELFGLKCWGAWEQPIDDYSLGGYLVLQPHALCEGIPSRWHPHQKLLIFSTTRLLQAIACHELARFSGHDYSDEGFAAVTARPVQKGWACYFAFDLPKTVWLLHQGRPMQYDRDGVGVFRTSDQLLTGHNHPEVLYADSLLFLLQNMLALAPQPFIYQLPPRGEQVPEAGFYWGGDDEGEYDQVAASNFMRERGLPYHINIMPEKGSFRLTPEEFAQIRANGHECSLHYNFTEGEPLQITKLLIQRQADAYRARFGQDFITSVSHCIRWAEGAEMAVWLREAGGRADNSFCHEDCTVFGGDPYNRFGFAFGTGYPFYLYRDFRHGNERVDLLEEPFVCYELGCTRRLDDSGNEITDFPRLHRALDMALHWHLLMNMFYHPYSLVRRARQHAISEVLRYLGATGKVVAHLGNDAVYHWWDRRSASTVEEVAVRGPALSFRTRCAYPEGMIVKVPLGQCRAQKATRDAKGAPFVNRPDFGQNWTYVVVPEGEHQLEIEVQ